MHTYMHACVRAYIHTYIHIYTHGIRVLIWRSVKGGHKVGLGLIGGRFKVGTCKVALR